MKKMRMAALTLLAVLLITLLPGAAASTIVLTAVNDRFLPLSASTMPVRRSGEWYVPYAVFTEFPVAASLQEDEDLLVLQSSDTTLSFSLSQGYAYDHNMTSYAQPAYQMNGSIYVPVKLVCGLFGLSFSLISGDQPVLRICDSNAEMSDHIFISKISGQAGEIVDEYKGAEAPPRPKPTPPPEDTGPEPVPPEQIIEPARIRPQLIYLTFSGPTTEFSADLLDTLSAYGRKATFFLPASAEWDKALLRRVAAEGHTIGLQITPQESDQPALLTAANEQLFLATGQVTRLVSIAGGSDQLTQQQRDLVTHAGYRLWDATVVADDETKKASQVAAVMLKSFDGTTATTVLGMHHTRSTNAALTLILRDLRVNGVKTAPVWVSANPVNRAGETR